MLATLLLVPGFQTSIMALATLWAPPSVQKWSLYENRGKLRIREEGEGKNGGRVKI